MRAAFIFIIVFLTIFVVMPANADETSIDSGTVSGKILVWRTRVRTEGPRNDRDVIVYLEDTTGRTYAENNRTVNMDQKNLIFIPHVLAVEKGTVVTFLNSDTVDHNVYLLFEKNGESLDLGTWGQGKTTQYLFNEAGVVIVLCKLHLEMAAYIATMENPYFVMAAIDKDSQSAAFTIKNVPPGSYLLKSWHKKLKMKSGPAQITVEKDKISSFDITITKPQYARE